MSGGAVSGTNRTQQAPTVTPAQRRDLEQLRDSGYRPSPNGIEPNRWLNEASRRSDPRHAQYRELVDIAGGRTDRPSLLRAMEVAQAWLTATAPNASAADRQGLVNTLTRQLEFHLGRLNPTELLTSPLQSAARMILSTSGAANTEWGQSLDRALGQSVAFNRGLAEGIWEGGKSMVTGIATMVGRTLQYGADNSAIGTAGDALRGLTGQMPAWLEQVIPSNARGAASTAAIASAMSGAANYISSHSPAEIAADIGKVISTQWDSLKASHAAAAAQGPEAEARWWGQTVGRVGFEVAATFVPVAGVAGKISGAARATDAVVDTVRVVDAVADGTRTADRVADGARAADGISNGARAANGVGDGARAADDLARATGGAEKLLERAKRILGDLPLNTDTLDNLYQAGKLTMNEARALAKNANWKDADGNWIYPPDKGFHTPGRMQPIDQERLLDRYGGFIDRDTGAFRDTGNFLSPKGASFESRALPPGTRESKAYKVYEVLVPFEAKVGKATPWFDQPGMGQQIMTDGMNIESLIKRGYIREVTQ
jgi:hypothetical protein